MCVVCTRECVHVHVCVCGIDDIIIVGFSGDAIEFIRDQTVLSDLT